MGRRLALIPPACDSLTLVQCAWDHARRSGNAASLQGRIVVVGARDAVRAEPRVAWLAGASGLTGSALLRLLLGDTPFARVIALSRRPLPLEHARLANRILRLEEVEASLKGARCSDAFCALGAAGGPRADAAQLDAVDLQGVLAFARAARAGGANRFVVISAAGADRNAGNAFLRTKGEMEAALRTLGFAALDILQPGVIVGTRPGDGAAALVRQGLLAAAAPLLRRAPRGLAPVAATELAAAMLGCALSGRSGIRTLAGPALQAASRVPRRTA